MNSSKPLLILADAGGPTYLGDCACPEKTFLLSPPPVSLDHPLRHPQLHIQTLPAHHTLLFNPDSDVGVAVINKPAEAIWQKFKEPRRLQDLNASGDFVSFVGQLARAGLLENAGPRVKLRRKKPTVLSTWIHVTNECNLRCAYCYIQKSKENMSEEVGRATVDALFRSAVKHNFNKIKLKFAGGEATMNLRRVFDLHSYALAKAERLSVEIEAVILSNGVSLETRAIEELEDRGIRVCISLDGVGRYHDSQRSFANGAGSFRSVNRTIDRLIERGIKPFISITLSGRNAEGLPEVVEFVVERDLPFNINFFRENDCSAQFEDLKMQDEKIIDAIRRAFTVLEHHLPNHNLLNSLVDRAQFDQPHEKTCSVGDSYLVVDHRGNVAKCQMEIERPITTVYEEDPLTFIRADKAGIQNLSVEEKEGCRDCEWKYWCAGGCPALTYRVTGRYDVKSPNCRIYKAIYPEALRLEGMRLVKLASRYL